MIGTSKINGCTKRLWPITMSLLLAVGCTTAGDEEAESLSLPLAFTTSVDTQTRGEELTTDNLDAVGIFAYFTNGTFDASTAMPNFMYNQILEKSGGSWTYSPLKYWPNNESDRISFVAYAPYVVEAVGSNPSFSGNKVADHPILTYTLPVTETSKQDFLVGNCLNRKSSGGVVALTMQHTLTQVTFKVKNSKTATFDAVLTGLEILMPATGALSFKNAPASDDFSEVFAWGSYGAQTTLTADVNLGNSTTIPLGGTPKEVAAFYLFPLGDPSSLATPRLTYTIQKKSPSPEEPVTLTVPVSLPATPAWNPGEGITYVISVVDYRLEVEEVTSINDFTAGDTGIAGGDITAT